MQQKALHPTTLPLELLIVLTSFYPQFLFNDFLNTSEHGSERLVNILTGHRFDVIRQNPFLL